MTMIISRSDQPLPVPLTEESRYFLFDGTLFPDCTRWLKRHGVSAQPIPALADGQYDALSAMGPQLIPMPVDSRLVELWEQRQEPMQTGSVLHVTCPEQVLVRWLRARSQVRIPDGRAVWLRLGDAAVLKRLLDNAAQVPAHFLAGLNRISFNTSQCAYHFQCMDADASPVMADKVAPHFYFNSELIAALKPSSMAENREVV
jgi:hypothetical protein